MEYIKSDYKCGSASRVYNKRKVDNLKKNIDISIFKNPIFILFIFSNFCTSIGFYIPYIYILVCIKFY